MKPNFALNLTHEGISLLHRAKAGWLRVGDVKLDDPDFNEQLKVLRKTAADLESGGLASKLVIPNSQILYTEIEAPGPDAAARASQIRDGLVGLTPYEVDDLVFDWRLSGTRAQVAIVARETLQEAEAFAAEFRFNPVSFVAVPVNGAFDGEPFFGPTKHAASLLVDGDNIEPDRHRMNVLGSGEDRPEPKPTPKPKPKDAAKPAETAIAASPAPIVQPVAPKPKQPPVPKPQPKPDAMTKPETEAEKPLPLTFSSRRAAMPGKSPLPKVTPPSGSASAPILPPNRISAMGTPPTADPAARPHDTPVSALDLNDVPEMPVWRTANGKGVTPMPMTSGLVADPPARGDIAADHLANARTKAMAAGSAIAGTLGKLGQGGASGMRRMRSRKEAIAASASEAETMTMFGARRTNAIRGKPRYLGLALTLLLLLALAILALWSIYFTSDTDNVVFGAPQQPPQIAAVDPAADVPDESSPTPDTSLPELANPLAQSESPEMALPETESDGATLNAIDAAVETALLLTQPPEADLPATEPPTAFQEDVASLDPEAEADAGLDQALPDNPAPDQIGRPPPTQAEAEASYAATGIWQMDPAPLESLPGGDRLDDIYVASIDPVIRSSDAIALPDARAQLNDQRPPSLNPPAPLGTDFDLDERGLVRATPEGTVSPDGIRVFSGSPPVVPGLRPGSGSLPARETPAAQPDPEQERLRLIRPTPRPETLQETNERSNLGGFSRSELAAIRPGIRPLSIQEEVAAATAAAKADTSTETATETDTASGTELAVLASLFPTGRPADFSSTIEKALEEASKNQPETSQKSEPEVAAAIAPPLPVRASVAKRATEQNAINLGKINLIGVYGTPSDRRALVRLKTGRYIKVEVGDSVDGGRVAAIGDDELRYVKSGNNITLKMPKG